MIPVAPDWRTIVTVLHRHFGTYDKLVNALAEQDVYPDYTTLAHLRSGYARAPMWKTGAALLNLHAQIQA